MRLTIRKKIILLLLFLYPFFALSGIIGILGVEAVGRTSYEIIDRNNLLNFLYDIKAILFKIQLDLTKNNKAEISTYTEILQQRILQSIDFIDGHRFHLGEVSNKVKILREIVKELQILEASEIGDRVGNIVFALDTLIDSCREEFRKAASLPYRTQSASIVALAILTLGIIIIGGFGAGLIGQSIDRPLKRITEITKAISDLKGDLTQRLSIETSDEIAGLAESFNKMVENLSVLIAKIRDVVINVADSSNRIKELTKTQTELTLRQSSQIDEADSFIKRLESSAGHIAQSANVLSQISEKNSRLVEQGVKAVMEAGSGVENIRKEVDSIIRQAEILTEKSNSVNKISNWIEEISKKIDLFALNLDIEATRSEAIEGISVLATEVRKLSERSRSLTKDIENILVEIQREINNTVSIASLGIQEIKKDLGLIDSSRQSIEEMSRITEETNQRIKEISVITQQQEDLSRESAKLIDYILDLSKRTLSLSNEIYILSQQIDVFSNQLKQAVGEFRL